jgi:hypothetical protein
MTDELNNVGELAESNTKVRLRLQPVLPVMMVFYCECANPPRELPGPFNIIEGPPPRYQHRCPGCGTVSTLNHASGAVVFQKLNNPDDVPKLTIAQSLPS